MPFRCFNTRADSLCNLVDHDSPIVCPKWHPITYIKPYLTRAKWDTDVHIALRKKYGCRVDQMCLQWDRANVLIESEHLWLLNPPISTLAFFIQLLDGNAYTLRNTFQHIYITCRNHERTLRELLNQTLYQQCSIVNA